ncbi:MAG: hypothetical protein WCO58_00075 [bacterium]
MKYNFIVYAITLLGITEILGFSSSIFSTQKNQQNIELLLLVSAQLFMFYAVSNLTLKGLNFVGSYVSVLFILCVASGTLSGIFTVGYFLDLSSEKVIPMTIHLSKYSMVSMICCLALRKFTPSQG